jgi:NADPH-dependent glutamate synthase beta subunit-like oxidoreductase
LNGSKRGQQVAVIGAGPAGIAAAWDLNQRGFEVTIYDRESKPGGMLHLRACPPPHAARTGGRGTQRRAVHGH